MNADQLPTTPGSVAADENGHRYALTQLFWGVRRWFCLTRWERRPPDADELAQRNPTVLYVAPEWTTDPGVPPL